MKNVKSYISTVAIASFMVFGSIAAHAATVNLKADLTASAEVPANDSAGTGTLTATLDTDTHELKYHIEFSGLSGPVLAAHFHGPAAAGENAKVQVPITTKPITSPIEGTATLTEEQSKDLLDGKWYFNIHTAAHHGGEIRGQIMKSE